MQLVEKLEPCFFYHIYNRGNNKENIFIEEKNYCHFLNLCKKHLDGVAEVYAYNLLKNHFRLLVKILENGKDPSKAFQIFLMHTLKASIRNMSVQVVFSRKDLAGKR